MTKKEWYKSKSALRKLLAEVWVIEALKTPSVENIFGAYYNSSIRSVVVWDSSRGHVICVAKDHNGTKSVRCRKDSIFSEEIEKALQGTETRLVESKSLDRYNDDASMTVHHRVIASLLTEQAATHAYYAGEMGRYQSSYIQDLPRYDSLYNQEYSESVLRAFGHRSEG